MYSILSAEDMAVGINMNIIINYKKNYLLSQNSNVYNFIVLEVYNYITF